MPSVHLGKAAGFVDDVSLIITSFVYQQAALRQALTDNADAPALPAERELWITNWIEQRQMDVSMIEGALELHRAIHARAAELFVIRHRDSIEHALAQFAEIGRLRDALQARLLEFI